MTQYQIVQVGVYKLKEEREITQHYECAAWHKTLVCPPGEYPVYAHLTWVNVAEKTLGHSLYAPFEGVISSASFRNRIGAHMGSDDGPEMVGKMEKSSMSLPTFELDEEFYKGTLEFDETLISKDVWTSSDGIERTLFRLKPEGLPSGRPKPDPLTAMS